jgi:hypothetical protein
MDGAFLGGIPISLLSLEQSQTREGMERAMEDLPVVFLKSESPKDRLTQRFVLVWGNLLYRRCITRFAPD